MKCPIEPRYPGSAMTVLCFPVRSSGSSKKYGSYSTVEESVEAADPESVPEVSSSVLVKWSEELLDEAELASCA